MKNVGVCRSTFKLHAIYNIVVVVCILGSIWIERYRSFNGSYNILLWLAYWTYRFVHDLNFEFETFNSKSQVITYYVIRKTYVFWNAKLNQNLVGVNIIYMIINMQVKILYENVMRWHQQFTQLYIAIKNFIIICMCTYVEYENRLLIEIHKT